MDIAVLGGTGDPGSALAAQPLNRKIKMYYSVHFLDNISNSGLKLILKIKNLSTSLARVNALHVLLVTTAVFSRRDSRSLAFVSGG